MSLKFVIKPFEKDLGEFMVRRTLPSAEQKMIGPWVFFDHMGPVDFKPRDGISVRPHPHINLATVTYVFEGEILHRDSLGNEQAIRPGDLNLMVAGSGITHSERESEEVNQRDHRLHGLQLWHALPVEDEEIAPAFYHYPESVIPKTVIDDIPVRVMMGSAYGLSSPVKTFARTLYMEADLKAGQTLTLPQEEEAALYVAAGKVSIDAKDVPQYSMAVLDSKTKSEVVALSDSRVALIGGEPVGERHLEWNFVSSRKDRIEQAKKDWLEGKFPKVPGDEKEFIPLPGS